MEFSLHKLIDIIGKIKNRKIMKLIIKTGIMTGKGLL